MGKPVSFKEKEKEEGQEEGDEKVNKLNNGKGDGGRTFKVQHHIKPLLIWKQINSLTTAVHNFGFVSTYWRESSTAHFCNRPVLDPKVKAQSREHTKPVNHRDKIKRFYSHLHLQTVPMLQLTSSHAGFVAVEGEPSHTQGDNGCWSYWTQLASMFPLPHWFASTQNICTLQTFIYVLYV